jgi:hypothetical protein
MMLGKTTVSHGEIMNMQVTFQTRWIAQSWMPIKLERNECNGLHIEQDVVGGQEKVSLFVFSSLLLLLYKKLGSMNS